MAPKPRTWLVLVAVLSCTGIVAHLLKQQEDADRLLQRAERLLHAPIEAAPELWNIQAQKAAAILTQARQHADTPRLQRLEATARALDALQKEQYDVADRALAQARSAKVSDPLIDVTAAALALARDDRDAVGKHLDAALEQDPHHPRALLARADLFLDASAPAEALAVLARLASIHPRAGVVLNRRGLAYQALGEPAAAMADFRRASTADTRSHHPHLNMGRMLREQARHGEAEQAFGHALDRAPAEPDAWLGRGLSRAAQGDLEGAQRDLERARELAPQYADPIIALGDLAVARGDRDRAILRYRAALTIDPAASAAWVKLGNARMRQGDYSEARDAFGHAIAHSPDMAQAHNGLGAAQLVLGDTDAAAVSLAMAASLDQRDPNPLLNLARLHVRRGDETSARAALQRAQQRDPSVQLASLR